MAKSTGYGVSTTQKFQGTLCTHQVQQSTHQPATQHIINHNTIGNPNSIPCYPLPEHINPCTSPPPPQHAMLIYKPPRFPLKKENSKYNHSVCQALHVHFTLDSEIHHRAAKYKRTNRMQRHHMHSNCH